MNPSHKQFVKDLKEKQVVSSVFLASDKMVLTDKNGKPYMSVNLNDVTGSINGRLWEKVDEFEKGFQAGDLVFVKGHIQVYQNRRQMVVHEIKKAEEGQFDMRDFVRSSARPSGEMLNELLGFVENIRQPQLKALIKNVLADNEIQPLLLKSPAAKSIHHAYYGGLLEHVLSICHMMKFISQHYSFLNYDLLIFGAIFHDIGKVWELSYNQAIDYTDRGRLVGHMALACELVDKKAQEIPGFSTELRDICKHIILSHHGKLEYGSPILPKFPEAYVVSMIDDFDSKLNTMQTFMTNEMESQELWTRYHQGFDSYLYLGILRKPEFNPSAK